MIKVSILIPTYKRPDLIVEAINSCLDQSYAPYEIIIGDDSPDELTAAVVAKIQKESSITIRYIHNKPSLKQARNVNMLFSAATGDKALLLHDDDLLMPASLETLVNVFETHPSVNVAFGKQYIINSEGVIDHESSESFNRAFYRIKENEGSVLSPFEAGLSQQFPNNGYLIDTEIIKKIQWDVNAGDACDYDFGYRIGLAEYKMFFVDQYLGKYRLSPNSISHSKSSDCAYRAYHLLTSCSPNSEFSAAVKSKRLYERAPIAITEAVNLGKKSEAVSILFSKWYRGKILTAAGLKRVAYILFYSSHLRLPDLKSFKSLFQKKKDKVEYSL